MNSGIFFSDNGTGLPVVLIHGFCETHKLWHQLAPKFNHTFRIITIDLPGFGNSPLPDPPFSLTDIAGMIHDLLLENEISNPVLIGHSLGGYITLAYAKKYGNELRGFGLFHSTAYADSMEKKVNRTKLIEIIEKQGVLSFIGTFVPSLFYENRRQAHDAAISYLINDARSTSPKSIQEYARAMRDREENLELLKTFQKPIMMIIGENDGSIPLSMSLEQSKMIQRPYILRLKETAHMGMFERPSETYNFIQNFLNVC